MKEKMKEQKEFWKKFCESDSQYSHLFRILAKRALAFFQ
jgi:hypothetical protein